MKVALVSESANAARGGAERSTLELAAALRRAGHDVDLWTSGEPGAPAADAGLRLVPVRGAGRAARREAFLADVGRLLPHVGYDVVHSFAPLGCADVYQPRGGTERETQRRSRAPLRRTRWGALRHWLRSLSPAPRAALARQEALLHRFDPPCVAALSEYVRRQVLDVRPDFPPDRIRVLFNAVDSKPLEAVDPKAARELAAQELDLRPGQRLLVFIAHNFRLKGLAELIQAVARGRGDTRLAVLGRDRAAEYRLAAARLGVSNRVHFLGARDDAHRWLAAADLLAHPTWYDPCSRVVLEALVLGIPVVTTRWNGAAEAVARWGGGRVVDEPENTAALAAAIHELLEAPPTNRTRRRDEVIAALSLERQAAELSAWYEELHRLRREAKAPLASRLR